MALPSVEEVLRRTRAVPPIWPPFAVGAMAALRTPNCDYAARPGDALRIAVALFPVSDAAGRRVPARTGRRDHCRRTPPLAAAVLAAGPSAGQTAGAYGAKSLSRITCTPRVRGGPCPPRRRTAGADDDDLRSHGSRPGRTDGGTSQTARATPWTARSRASASAVVRFLAFDSKLGTKACSPIGLGGNVRSVCIVAAAWSVRSFHCSISNPEVSMAVRNRSGVVRWLYSGRSAQGTGKSGSRSSPATMSHTASLPPLTRTRRASL